MDHFRYVILGGGVTAGYAAKELAELGLRTGELCIVSKDDALPYDRPPLSKDFLSTEMPPEGVLVNDENFYNQHGIDVRLSAEVNIVDLEKKLLHTTRDEQIGFDKLVIANGVRPRTFDLPGAAQKGIIYLRSLDDARGIRVQAQDTQNAVVIGGGYIGMEVASQLQQRGLETDLLVHGDRVMHKLFTPEMSAFFERYYKERGVRLHKNAEPVSFSWNGRESGVRLKNGDYLPAEMIVAGLGVIPNTELFEGTGLLLDNGVVVNEYLETNIPNVYAAGDIANYYDVLYETQRRIEHWDNAVEQGQHVARILTNRREPFVQVPYFFSDVFDLSWEFWGDPTGATSIIQRGDIDSGSFSIWWLWSGRLIAAFVMNRSEDEREVAPAWIRSQEQVPLELLENPDLALDAPYPAAGEARTRGA